MGNLCCTQGQGGTGRKVSLIGFLMNSSKLSCDNCSRACGFNNGRCYYKCLECSNEVNICEGCHKLGHHNAHLLALVDTAVRQELVEILMKKSNGWPIVFADQRAERRLVFRPNCSGGDYNDHGVVTCRKPVAYMCLQCPTTFGLCVDCFNASTHYSNHIFALADNESLQFDFIAHQIDGVFPLDLSSEET